MKGFALLVAGLLGAGLLYVTTAVGGPQAGPTRAEFNAVKRQIAALKRDNESVKGVLGACLTGAVPGARYRGYVYQASDGSVLLTTALDVVEQGQTPTMYLLDVGQECANGINTSTLGLHGLKLVRPAATRR